MKTKTKRGEEEGEEGEQDEKEEEAAMRVSDFLFSEDQYMRTGAHGQSSSSSSHSPHQQCTVGVLIIAELVSGRWWSINLDTNVCPSGDLIPGLLIGSRACSH